MNMARKYVFDDPAARQRERELAAVRVRSDQLSGQYSVESYKDRLATQRGPVTTEEERKAAHAFNLTYKRHKAGKCKRPCYWCGHGLPLIDKRTTKEPESVTAPRLREDRNAIFR